MNAPTLKFYHANARGTGSALSVSLTPATPDADGALVFTLEPQAAGIVPTFDHAEAIDARLPFADVCELLRVFRGECESIADGKGLYHRTPGACLRVSLRHMVEPVLCYSFELCQMTQGAEDRRAQILLTPAEALGLTLCLEHSLPALCFGVNA